jgi:transitional endoplasmic reticulum ATPase
MERGEALEGAVMVGTINVVSAVDPALLRPGRFDEVVEIAEPDASHRARIAAHYLEQFGLPPIANELSAKMTGFAPADVREVVQCLAAVGLEHIDAEIARVARQRVLYGGDACERYTLRIAANTAPKALTDIAR